MSALIDETLLPVKLGTYRTGHLILDIAQAAGDEIIDVIFSEDLDKSGAPLLRKHARGVQR